MKRVRLITVPRLGHLLSVGVDWVVDRVQLPRPARWLVFTIAVCQLGRTLLMRFAGVGPCTTQGLCWATIQGLFSATIRGLCSATIRGLCWATIQGLCWATIQGLCSAIYRDSTLPLYRDPAGPLYRDPARPLYRDSARPLYRDSARPLYRDPARPLYRDHARPLYRDSARPLSTWFSQGLDRNELLGWNFCSFWTVLTLLQTCSRSCGVIFREELPATGPRSQEVEEKEIQAY